MPRWISRRSGAARRWRSPASSLSVATRLAIFAVLVAMVSLVIAAAVSLREGSRLADRAIRDRLVTVAASRATQVNAYMWSLQRKTAALALSPATAQDVAELSEAYRAVGEEAPDESARERLREYYLSVVGPELEAARDEPIDTSALIPSSASAVTLQSLYVAGEDGRTAGSASIDDAGDGSRWSELHASMHPIWRDISNTLGLDDLYLVDARDGVILYSVHKGIDFATSVDVGPMSGTTLAEMAAAVRAQPTEGRVVSLDFARYPGAGDQPAAFLGSPVLDGGQLVGMVVARFGPAGLNGVTTRDGNWEGFGQSGEIYLAAKDETMRSDARPFVEDPTAYVVAATEKGSLTESQRHAIQEFDTTVLFQSVNDEVVQAALANGSGVMKTMNYLREHVLTAYRLLEIDGLEWVLIAEVRTSEVETPVTDYARNLLVAMALLVVGITFLAVRWSNGLVQPLRLASERLRQLRMPETVSESSASQGPPRRGSGAQEFVELAADIELSLDRLAMHQVELKAKADERHDLLRRFLPPGVLPRAEAGERDVLDVVPYASVAVVVIHGLGELVRLGAKQETRDLLDRIVDEIDALAHQYGLERVKLTGDAYYAACGTARPFLDHAPRSLRFVLAVQELVSEIATESGHGLSISAGLDSGPITVGLTGGARLVYDSWGPTVTIAAALCRRASSGQILISDAIRSQLPSSFEIVEIGVPGTGPNLSAVVGDTEAGDRETGDGERLETSR